MDQSVVDAKLESLRRCVARVAEKCPPTATELARDVDAQDIIALNLSRAVQLCIDLALHKISSSGEAAPSTMSGAFDTLVVLGAIDEALAKRMKSAVGFRNLAVHQYETMDWQIVHAICKRHLDDFRAFAVAIRTT
jgi:uncharacterized protein YutE (UPF0331/DUF86 family)